jgi:hypothetical protein
MDKQDGQDEKQMKIILHILSIHVRSPQGHFKPSVTAGR